MTHEEIWNHAVAAAAACVRQAGGAVCLELNGARYFFGDVCLPREAAETLALMIESALKREPE